MRYCAAMLEAEPVVGKATRTTAPLTSTLPKVSMGDSVGIGQTTPWTLFSVAAKTARPAARDRIMAGTRVESPMGPALAFHPLRETQAAPERLAEMLLECKAVLLDRGMADMEEYGDMLKWGLPRRGGKCRSMHVYHPDWCSFSDRFRGTIHYHGGAIRGTLLLGQFEHSIYETRRDPAGDRFHEGEAYTLTRHTRVQGAGTTYELPAMVPHWLRPTRLTMTSFQEEDNGLMGDLVNPGDDVGLDEHRWTQAQADALLPVLLGMIDAKLAELTMAPLAPSSR